MAPSGGSETSRRPSRKKVERDPAIISAEDMRKYIKVAGKPWFNRRKKVSLKRVEALRSAGFSIRQIARIYKTSDSTIRRRIKGD